MHNTKFRCIISKSSTDFGRKNLVEMGLPTTGLPVIIKTVHYPFEVQIIHR